MRQKFGLDREFFEFFMMDLSIFIESYHIHKVFLLNIDVDVTYKLYYLE